ncbi:hypothetical protein ZIOFF_012140 [Zingiber officinale]|uniref:Uncharacterized protein n=1 Tax=Zingiber officinale TaxID=94328 RepID=A0A8J5LTQ3_ZINOF|nr:hypothetical protein ZIOFF_012140 [Zingiber officinale]
MASGRLCLPAGVPAVVGRQLAAGGCVSRHLVAVLAGSWLLVAFAALLQLTYRYSDAIRRNSSKSFSVSVRSTKRGMVLPFQPLSLAFNHVNYYVDMPAVSKSHICCFSILI